MPTISRRWIAIGALLGAIGVGLGAYGAHGLSRLLENRLGYTGDDLHHRLDIFETAVRYQMFHAAALVMTGLALALRDTPAWRFAAWAFLAGMFIFSGLLKVLAFAPPSYKWLGAIVPFGGLLLIIAWLALAAGALKKMIVYNRRPARFSDPVNPENNSHLPARRRPRFSATPAREQGDNLPGSAAATYETS